MVVPVVGDERREEPGEVQGGGRSTRPYIRRPALPATRRDYKYRDDRDDGDDNGDKDYESDGDDGKGPPQFPFLTIESEMPSFDRFRQREMETTALKTAMSYLLSSFCETHESSDDNKCLSPTTIFQKLKNLTRPPKAMVETLERRNKRKFGADRGDTCDFFIESLPGKLKLFVTKDGNPRKLAIVIALDTLSWEELLVFAHKEIFDNIEKSCMDPIYLLFFSSESKWNYAVLDVEAIVATKNGGIDNSSLPAFKAQCESRGSNTESVEEIERRLSQKLAETKKYVPNGKYLSGKLYKNNYWFGLPSENSIRAEVLYEGLLRVIVGDHVKDWSVEDVLDAIKLRVQEQQDKLVLEENWEKWMPVCAALDILTPELRSQVEEQMDSYKRQRQAFLEEEEWCGEFLASS